jgi:four helix bundle protein
MKRTVDHEQVYRTFEDLEVYQVAREFRKSMYGVAKRLPDIEKFGLRSQIRRAALSLTNNIAEGHGRFHFLDQIKFMFQSRGSLEELLDDLNTCDDENYAPQTEVDALKEKGWEVHRLINGYVRFLRSRLEQYPSRIKETSEPYGDGADPFNPSSLQPFNE